LVFESGRSFGSALTFFALLPPVFLALGLLTASTGDGVGKAVAEGTLPTTGVAVVAV